MKPSSNSLDFERTDSYNSMDSHHRHHHHIRKQSVAEHDGRLATSVVSTPHYPPFNCSESTTTCACPSPRLGSPWRLLIPCFAWDQMGVAVSSFASFLYFSRRLPATTPTFSALISNNALLQRRHYRDDDGSQFLCSAIRPSVYQSSHTTSGSPPTRSTHSVLRRVEHRSSYRSQLWGHACGNDA